MPNNTNGIAVRIIGIAVKTAPKIRQFLPFFGSSYLIANHDIIPPMIPPKIGRTYQKLLRDRVAVLLLKKAMIFFFLIGNLKKTNKNPDDYSYQIILQDNLQQFANFIADKKKELDFIIPKMELNRKDNLKMRERILGITNEERKVLGINKSTLWYMKNNLKEGKTIDIYDKVLAKINKASLDMT